MQKLWFKLKLLIIALDQYYLDCSVTPIESSEQSDEHEHVLEKDDNKAPTRSKVTILLCTLWTILPCPLQRHMHIQMQMIGKKQSKVRWTQFFLMEHVSSLNDPMVASRM